MKKTGEIREKIPEKFREKSGGKPLEISRILRELLSKRGVKTDAEIREFLAPDFAKTEYDPFLFPDMKKAVARIKKAKKNGEKITIYGDYDIDGMTATVILWESLRKFGLEVATYTPDRFTEGYGLNCDAISKIAADGAKLIITVDNGTLSFDEIAFAKKLGLDVIVTDHHSPHMSAENSRKAHLPNAVAVINPKIQPAENPEFYDEKFRLLSTEKIRGNLYKSESKKLPKILLTGAPRSGKTTLLRNFLSNFNGEKIGFLTREICENDERIGFELVDFTEKKTSLASKKISSKVRVASDGVDVLALKSFLKNFAKKLPEMCENSLLYIDEIGEIQLEAPDFAKIVENFLAQPNLFIGTISQPEFFANSFTEEICAREDILLLEITPENREIVLEILTGISRNFAFFAKLKQSEIDEIRKIARKLVREKSWLSLKKLFVNSVKYLAENRVKEKSQNEFLVRGNRGDYIVNLMKNKYICMCDMFNRRGKYINAVGDCSHILAVKIYEKIKKTEFKNEQKTCPIIENSRKNLYPFCDPCGVGTAFILVRALQIDSLKNAENFAKSEEKILKSSEKFQKEIVAKTLIRNQKTGKFLTLIRGKTHPKYALHRDFSGGIVEEDEDISAGAAREIFEEINLKIPAENLHGIWRGNFGETTGILYFTEIADAKNLKKSWEHERIEWLNFDEILDEKLPKDADPYYKNAMNFLRENRGKFAQNFWNSLKEDCEISQNPYLIPLANGQEKWFLDLVALGTVCDIVGLVDENRANVKWGIEVLKKTRRPGIRALLAVANVKLTEVNSETLGFVLGPRLNAAGRMETAEFALKLLKLHDVATAGFPRKIGRKIAKTQNDVNARALELATKLDNLNKNRRKIQDEIFAKAVKKVDEKFANDAVLVVDGNGWHEGIIGIVAAKIMEKYRKPTFILSRGKPEKVEKIREKIDEKTGKKVREKVSEKISFAKGSARSFGEFSCAEVIHFCDGIIERGGGHLAAGGLTLRADKIDEFRETVQIFYSGLHLENQEKWLIPRADLTLKNFAKIDEKLLNEIAKMEPFGHENEAPIFEFRDVKIAARKVLGSEKTHVKYLFADDEKRTFEAIAFSAADKFLFESYDENGEINRVNIRVQLAKNEWNGRVSVEGRLLFMEKNFRENAENN